MIELDPEETNSTVNKRECLLTRRIIDLSIPLANGLRADPLIQIPSITYLGHKDTMPDLLSFFPDLKSEELPDGEAWAVERVAISTHNGTHLDAPWHYHSTMNRGERSMTIDEVPLDWCFQPGVKLDFRHFDDGYVVTAADVEVGHCRKALKEPSDHVQLFLDFIEVGSRTETEKVAERNGPQRR